MDLASKTGNLLLEIPSWPVRCSFFVAAAHKLEQNEIAVAEWVERAIEWEEQERGRRSLERRLTNAHLGRFKPVCDFDWSWPKSCDRAAFESLMTLEFLKDAANVVLIGPNGVGKTTPACNIAYQAVVHGHTVLFTTAGRMLGDLAAIDSDTALRSRLRHYARPALLYIDEVGYLSYSNRHADPVREEPMQTEGSGAYMRSIEFTHRSPSSLLVRLSRS